MPEGARRDVGTPPVIDTSVAHSARVHDYWLGGTDHYPADRAAGDAVMAAYPGIVASVRANCAFLARAVRYLAGEAGIRQFPDVGRILTRAARTLDFAQPVAVMLIALMHFIFDADDPYGVVSSLLGGLPPGSYLALSQVASDVESVQVAEARRQFNQRSHQQQRHRSRDEVARFFAGLDLVRPGVVLVQQWRPGSGEEAAAQSTMWCGLARKP